MPTTSSLKEINWPKPREVALPIMGKTLLLPPWNDPRYLIWMLQLSFFVIGVEVVAFSKSYDALFVAVASAGLLDFVINAKRTGKWIFPQSGFIAGTGVALLVEAPALWVYAMAAVVAIASKHIFQFRGRHIFNPSCYGALFAFTLFPLSAISNVIQWGGVWWFTVFIWASGFLVGYAARVTSVFVAWILSFFFFAFVRSLITGLPLLTVAGVMTGSAFALFSFFMITDPRTTPNTWKKRALFCFLAAAVDAAFRMKANPYAVFWGLVFASALYPLVMFGLEGAAARVGVLARANRA